MSTRSLNLSDTLYRYLLEVSLREHPVQAALREFTRSQPKSNMQIAPEQGQFMALLVKLMGARKTLEIGVYTGYSTLSVALALPPEGRIVACDIEPEYTDVAQDYWRQAEIEDKIELRLAPANQTLDELIEAGEAGSFDFAFIDADKEGYDGYYERCLALLRPGGLLAIDNTLWNGSVAQPAVDDATEALQALNQKVLSDERVDLSLLPIGDGLSLARKREGQG